jgi:hypothetical protein
MSSRRHVPHDIQKSVDNREKLHKEIEEKENPFLKETAAEIKLREELSK